MVLILPIYTMLVHSEFRIIPDPAMLAQQQPKKKRFPDNSEKKQI
jgi:hypothetical protein